jgi:hypothetical protein
VVFASLFGIGLFAIAWQEYYPRSSLLPVMGISGPRANSGRRCQAGHYRAVFLSLPMRREMCFNGASLFTPHEGVVVDAVTRRVVSASRGWVDIDSTSWAKDVDSVSRSLVALGGAPYACKFAPTAAPPSSWKYWRVRGYFIRVTALGSNYEDVIPFQIGIDGAPGAPAECLHAPREADNSNVCAAATVRVPLPGHYEWCWRSPFGL